MLKQYYDFKKKHPETITLLRCGENYEAYENDAEVVAKLVGVVPFNADGGGVKTTAFPHYALNTYLPKFIRAGHRVAICDQLPTVCSRT